MQVEQSPTYTHIVEKKDVIIITEVSPLLFVEAPPMFVRVEVIQEESTSIFVKHFEEENEVAAPPPIMKNVEMHKKIHKLSEPFYRQVYRPLQFHIGEQQLKGTIERSTNDEVFIRTEETKEKVVAYAIDEIDEVLWRGVTFTM